MTEPLRTPDRLMPLLAELLDGQLTDAQLIELREILRQDPAARDFYARHLVTHALLHWEHAQILTAADRPAAPDRPATFEQPAAVDRPTAAKASATPPMLSQLSGLDARGTGSLPNASGQPIGSSFLGGWGAWAFSSPLRLSIGLMAMLGVLVLLIAVVLAPGHRKGDQDGNGGAARQVAQNQPERGPANPAGALVARLTNAIECRWSGDRATPETGAPLHVGQSLHLDSGVAEITFDVGVRIVLQGPASFAVESANSARMDMGKLTAEITTKEARGFRVVTPEATYVDQGTEFGVEVAPGGSNRVHVFKGEVDMTVNAKPGEAPPATQKLTANSAARLEHNNSKITLYEETGESFVRSMNQRDRDRHVVAYWRFEDHPVGNVVPDTQGNAAPIRGTIDSSFNGNDLFTYSAQTQPQFSDDVPAKIVPQSGQPNSRCLDNTHPKEWATRDVYTRSAFSHASPIDIQTITPTQWTIEASVKAKNWRRGVQTFVGRDGAAALPVVDVPPRLAFQVNAEGRFAIRYRDVNDRVHEAIAQQLDLAENQWYHVAAMSDGRLLSLYADALDGRGFRLVARTELPATGSTALGNGNNDTEWSIGRGKVAGLPDEWFQGWIDEVRVCDIALNPSEFLFAGAATK